MEIKSRSWRGRLLLLGVVWSASFCSGQSRGRLKEPTGVVTGHVYCADTNAPARLANVMLQPVKEAVKDPATDAAKKGSAEAPAGEGAAQMQVGKMPEMPAPLTVIQTALDGSFTFPRVKPGAYYVVVEKQGYLMPMTEFPIEEIEKPTREVTERMARLLHKVTVEANQTVVVEERIERGAAVSGTISFDDGSPAAGINLNLLRKKKDGTWESASSSGATSGYMAGRTTDDQGHYRMAGLPPAEYMVELKIAMSAAKVARSSAGMSMWSGLPGFSVSFFSGGAARKKDAAPFKVTAGEERVGEDIVIPLSKLHRVTGTLIAAHDGHVINAAEVQLLYSDDKTLLASANVGQDEPAFDFQFVPEGDYELKVINARDATWDEALHVPGVLTFPTEKAQHFYGEKEQPFNVREDTTGLVVSVPDKIAVTAPTTAGASASR